MISTLLGFDRKCLENRLSGILVRDHIVTISLKLGSFLPWHVSGFPSVSVLWMGGVMYNNSDSSPEFAMTRWREIDALRGLMLVMMTITHLPTRLSITLGQPLGFVSAAEGFVFLSA